MEQEPFWDFLLSEENQETEENGSIKTEQDSEKDCLLFEFSSEPLLPCYHVQVSLTQGWVHEDLLLMRGINDKNNNKITICLLE